MRRLLSSATIVAMTACGSSSPTAPSAPAFPSVGGSYSGVVTVTFPEIPQSITCPASTVVTQSAASVNIAPIVLSGPCGTLSLAMGSATIDQTGALLGTTSGTLTQACGTYTYAGSGGFFNREFRLSMTATSLTCFNFNFTAVLTR